MDQRENFAAQLEAINQANEKVQKAAAQLNKDSADFLIKVATGTYSAAVAYGNALVAWGFVVFFTVWSYTRQFVPEWAVLTTALMMALSAMLFVGFEIYKMLETQFLALALPNVVKATGGDLSQAIVKYQQRAESQLRRMFFVWMFVFPLTIASGYGAVLILVTFFVRALLHPLPGIAE